MSRCLVFLENRKPTFTPRSPALGRCSPSTVISGPLPSLQGPRGVCHLGCSGKFSMACPSWLWGRAQCWPAWSSGRRVTCRSHPALGHQPRALGASPSPSSTAQPGGIWCPAALPTMVSIFLHRLLGCVDTDRHCPLGRGDAVLESLSEASWLFLGKLGPPSSPPWPLPREEEVISLSETLLFPCGFSEAEAGP